MTVSPWKTISTKYILKDSWMSLRADRCETASGRILDPYYVQAPPNWVQVVAFDAQNRILLNRQYRHGIAEICTEVPCGNIEAEESPLQAAKRHLLEKTGYLADKLEQLPSACPNPARYSNKIFPFWAVNISKVREQKSEYTGEIEFYFAPISEVLNLIDRGAFQQPLHTATVFTVLRARGLISIAS